MAGDDRTGDDRTGDDRTGDDTAGDAKTGETGRSRATVFATWRESPLAVKTLLAGVFINRLSGFLNIFLVLYLTSQGHSPKAAAGALTGAGR